MAFNVGGMRSRVDIQRRVTTLDGVGGQSVVWGFLGTIWADIQAMTGHELQAAQAVRSTDTHKVIIRYFPGLTAMDRFVYTNAEGVSVAYNITDVIDVEKRHRHMECTAVEGLAEG